MRSEIKNAITIADAYRNSHEGEIPVLVVAHSEDPQRGELQHVYVGIFRNHKNHIHEDQKMFCSIMRMAFAMHNVTSYEVLVKPEFRYAMQGMTLNALAVVAVNETEQVVQWFEIEDEALTPHFSDEPMPVEGLFTQMLPAPAEREYEYNAKTVSGINAYLDNCTFVVPEIIAVSEIAVAEKSAVVIEEKEQTGADALLAAFS